MKTKTLLLLAVLSSLWVYPLKRPRFYSTDWQTQEEYKITRVFPYLPGFDNFRFYSTVDKVREQILKDNYAAGPDSIIQYTNDLYNYFDVKQEFIFYMSGANVFYNLSFTTNIHALKKLKPYQVSHLRQRDTENYIVIECPAGKENKKYPKWQHKFVFYNYKKRVYKLFAVVATYKNFSPGETTNAQFHFINNAAYEYYTDQIYDRYGSYTYKHHRNIDKYTYKEIMTFEHNYRKQSGHNHYDIFIQINVASVVFGGRRANFQVTYITPDYIKHDLFRIKLQEYTDPIVEGKEMIF
ncbi:MAG TPA: hypothetical protein VKS21_13310 [Spirochaetota bacterium]|nr:hypothetical protein [Spirochaetota bacterium]